MSVISGRSLGIALQQRRHRSQAASGTLTLQTDCDGRSGILRLKIAIITSAGLRPSQGSFPAKACFVRGLKTRTYSPSGSTAPDTSALRKHTHRRRRSWIESCRNSSSRHRLAQVREGFLEQRIWGYSADESPSQWLPQSVPCRPLYSIRSLQEAAVRGRLQGRFATSEMTVKTRILQALDHSTYTFEIAMNDPRFEMQILHRNSYVCYLHRTINNTVYSTCETHHTKPICAWVPPDKVQEIPVSHVRRRDNRMPAVVSLADEG